MKQELELEWRRNKVLELSSKGYSEREIGSSLQVSHITVHRDLVYLKKLAQENMRYHIEETVPSEYQKAMCGIEQNLKQTLEIAETVSDPRVKLQARSIANECYHSIIELFTNAGIVSDALKYVERKKAHLDNMQKIDDKIEDLAATEEEGEEGEETAAETAAETAGVF